ncbi:succinic semialdehyde dehydrogenase [Aquipuribacter sp. SD81]|uniref:succinic semialdehyde dehydrogenase n=1 Tax=Aquipuribacter sp. SD81 TaxID=3127703 RepID=UPI003017ADDB
MTTSLPRSARGRAAGQDPDGARGGGAEVPVHVVTGAHGPVVEVPDPATGGVLARVRSHTADDVPAVLARARAAQPAWQALGPAARARVVRRVHDLVVRGREDLADTVQDVTGKARGDAVLEVVNALQVSRHLWLRGPGLLRPRRRPSYVPGLTSARVERVPVGVVANVAAWNYPLVFVLSDSLAPLLAGDAVVVKPAQQSLPLALAVGRLLADAGVPGGVWQLVAGDDPATAQALVAGADHVLFTGSEGVGREVAALAGRSLVGHTLELGGKNAAYVAADADVDAAAAGLVRDCFGGAGQTCTATERLYVHAAVADHFERAFLARTRALRLGSRRDHFTDMGGLVSPAQRERVLGHVEDAVARGARVLTGGRARDDVGPAAMEPTVLTDVPADARAATEETFGPVVALTVVRDDEDAVTRMSDHPSGLAAALWTTDAGRARRLASRLRVGTVVVNESYHLAWGSPAVPLGGFGTSGYGRRYGPEGLAEVTRTRAVVTAHGGVVGRLLRQPPRRWEPVLVALARVARAVRLP